MANGHAQEVSEAQEGGVSRTALAAGTIGNFVEWYDFAIYAYSAPIIATLFFPEGNRTAALLATFAIYGVAFIVRPLGSVLFGHTGDRAGRRNTLATAALEEAIDHWPGSSLRRAQSTHSVIILASEDELSMSRATPMPPS